jgi:hypothetical protein
MTYPDHPFLHSFFERSTSQLSLTSFGDDLENLGMRSIQEHERLSEFEAAVAVANALEVDMVDWSEASKVTNLTAPSRIEDLRNELAAENALKGPVCYAQEDSSERFVHLFDSPEGDVLFCVLDDGKSWQAHMFFGTQNLAPRLPEVAGLEYDRVKSDSIDYTHFSSSREKTFSVEDLAQQMHQSPKRLDTAWSYLDFHGVPKCVGGVCANIAAYVFAEQYFGPTRELTK